MDQTPVMANWIQAQMQPRHPLDPDPWPILDVFKAVVDSPNYFLSWESRTFNVSFFLHTSGQLRTKGFNPQAEWMSKAVHKICPLLKEYDDLKNRESAMKHVGFEQKPTPLEGWKSC